MTGRGDSFHSEYSMSVNDLTGPAPTQGNKSVAAAATAERLSAASIRCSAVIVTAKPANTGKIAVGVTNGVLATAGNEKGIILAAGQSATIPSFDVMDVWIDASVNGEGVAYETAVL